MAIPDTVYKDLEAGEIRLLELSLLRPESPRRISEEPLCGQLVHFRLNSPPDYLALSYFWGTAQERGSTERIEIGNANINITRNVSDALRVMRSYDKRYL